MPKEGIKEANRGSLSLNKYISNTGLCSRREADKWIEQGRVSINNEVAKKRQSRFPKRSSNH